MAWNAQGTASKFSSISIMETNYWFGIDGRFIEMMQ